MSSATETETIPGTWDVDNLTYHSSNEFVGHSMLDSFRESPALYHGLYVSGTIEKPEPTAAMQLGSAFHAWMLERSKFNELIAITPEINRRTNAGKVEWAGFQEQHRGKAIIDAEQLEQVKRMAEAVKGNGLARDMLEAAVEGEVGIRWPDAATGIICKAKFDRPLKGAAIIVDVKTAGNGIDPDSWARAVGNFGYFRQSAHYLEGWRAVWGGKPDHFHIVFSTVEPWECLVYETDALSLELGAMQNARALKRLAVCRETGVWLHPLADQVNRISLPAWEFKKEEM